MKSILVLVLLSAVTQAFRPISIARQGGSLTVLHAQTQDASSVDWIRAKHCAEHFGSCDVDEVEDLYQRTCDEKMRLFLNSQLQFLSFAFLL